MKNFSDILFVKRHKELTTKDIASLHRAIVEMKNSGLIVPPIYCEVVGHCSDVIFKEEPDGDNR